MNGGIHDAIDYLTPEELCAAINGFSYFGFEGMAQRLGNAATDPLLKEWTDDTETLAVFRYAEFIPDDACLFRSVEAVYEEEPSEFAAL